jgi:alkylhydroperoxidase/carboxymuconolactone decarboxylase family protein YurZ
MTIGEVPGVMSTLAKYNPEVLKGYYHMRDTIFHGALGTKVLELIWLALDCAIGAPPDSIHLHARAAAKAGASIEEISDAISLTILLAGMLKFANYGMHALNAAGEAVKERSK